MCDSGVNLAAVAPEAGFGGAGVILACRSFDGCGPFLQNCGTIWPLPSAARTQYRARPALPEERELETFPFKRQPGINQRQLRTFAELELVSSDAARIARLPMPADHDDPADPRRHRSQSERFSRSVDDPDMRRVVLAWPAAGCSPYMTARYD